MRHLVLLFASVLLVARPPRAQTWQPQRLSAPDAPNEGPQVIHITDKLLSAPEAQRAVQEYHQLKAQGLLPQPGKTAQTPQLGEIRAFNVRREDSPTQCRSEQRDFELQFEADRFYIWVEVAERDNGNVSADDVTALADALANRTPAASINPNAGVIANDEFLFGDPPDADGDGKSDVLMLDVDDSYDPPNNLGFVAGYVDPCDLTSAGNARDVLYLDTNPGLISSGRNIDDVAETAAHEYQHLIHLTYNQGFEDVFINEGLSHWAQVANGYPDRAPTYLGDVSRYNVSFLSYDPADSNDDRQRGGLFTNYLADRLGIEVAGSVARQPTTGATGYREALQEAGLSVTLEDLIADFHVANYLNDVNVDTRFGYTTALRDGLAATASAVVDGRTGTQSQNTVFVFKGGVQYLVWDRVEDFTVTLDTSPTADRGRVRPTALLFRNGTVDIQTLQAQPDAHTFAGSYDRIAIVVPHTDLNRGTISLSYNASWMNEQTFTTEEQIYDDGSLEFNIVLTVSDDENASAQASRFSPPTNSILSRVDIGTYFSKIFDSSLTGTPDDLVLKVWADNGSGLPGEELFSLDVEDAVSNTNLTYSFTEIDLEPYRDDLTNLPDPVYVGMVDRGNDANYLFLAPAASNTDENTSFLGVVGTDGAEQWTALSNISFTDNSTGQSTSLAGSTLPIRASFLVSPTPIANEDATEIPDLIVLAPSYPNPFRATAAIRYVLPQTTDVTLRVYDVLGREMVTLVDGTQPAGEHEVPVDGSTWASGLYFYTLEADGQRATQRMVLVR